jgi:class 3 adenylate cyclase
VAERRVCSVLFCDVVGFTPLSESRDPEAVRELLLEYFEVARTVIGRYGGVVEKFIGDAVMAVWGTPVTAEGDAERAVRAALDLVAAVAQLGGDVGLPGLAPMQRAERDLARARLNANGGDPPVAGMAFAAAIAGLRRHSTPYHLAHGLLDYAEHIVHLGNADAAEAAVSEARDIAHRLRCQPLLDRAADLLPAESRIWAPMVTAPGPEESATVRDG